MLFPILLFAVDIALLTIAVLLGKRPTSLMGEGKLITWVSAAQLIGLGLLSAMIYVIKKEKKTFSVKDEVSVWALMALGFFFLAVDELTQIHENIKKWFHAGFNLMPTGWADRLDVLVTLIYGVIGIAVLLKYRRELSFTRQARFFIIGGIVLFFISTGLDAATEQRDVLPALFQLMQWPWISIEWFGVAEEGTKLLAEASILSAFYLAYRENRKKQAASVPAS